MESKEERASYPVITSLCALHNWTTQRCSWSYIEKRRGRKETEVARRIKGGLKRRETDPSSNQFPKCSPPSGTHRNSQSWIEKRRGREKTQATWWRKRSVQRGREQSIQ